MSITSQDIKQRAGDTTFLTQVKKSNPRLTSEELALMSVLDSRGALLADMEKKESDALRTKDFRRKLTKGEVALDTQIAPVPYGLNRSGIPPVDEIPEPEEVATGSTGSGRRRRGRGPVPSKRLGRGPRPPSGGFPWAGLIPFIGPAVKLIVDIFKEKKSGSGADLGRFAEDFIDENAQRIQAIEDQAKAMSTMKGKKFLIDNAIRVVSEAVQQIADVGDSAALKYAKMAINKVLDRDPSPPGGSGGVRDMVNKAKSLIFQHLHKIVPLDQLADIKRKITLTAGRLIKGNGKGVVGGGIMDFIGSLLDPVNLVSKFVKLLTQMHPTEDSPHYYGNGRCKGGLSWFDIPGNRPKPQDPKPSVFRPGIYKEPELPAWLRKGARKGSGRKKKALTLKVVRF